MLLFLITALLFNDFLLNEPFKIKAMTFNIHNGAVNDGSYSWQIRKNLVIQLIRKYDSDFVSLQEVLGFQLDEIMDELPEYNVVSRTREISPYEGEACPILYKKNKWELMESNTQWLSETPEVPGSRSWNCDFPRIFTMGVFYNSSSGYGIYLYNTHYGNVSSRARLKSSAVMTRHILNYTSHEYVIVMGDLNTGEDDVAIQAFVNNPLLELMDAYRFKHPRRLSKDATFYGWGGHSGDTGSRVDYIFNSSNFKILSSYVIDYQVNGKYPSDHCPVYAEFEVGTEK